MHTNSHYRQPIAADILWRKVAIWTIGVSDLVVLPHRDAVQGGGESWRSEHGQELQQIHCVLTCSLAGQHGWEC